MTQKNIANTVIKKPNWLKQFVAKQYSKIIPSNKFVLVRGIKDTDLTVQVCANLLSDKMKSVSYVAHNVSNPHAYASGLINTILKVTPSVEKIIVELNSQYFRDSDSKFFVEKPQTVILTSVSPNEVVYEENLDTKYRSVPFLNSLADKSTAILNWEDKNLRNVDEGVLSNILYYGFDDKNCHVWAGNIKIKDFSTTFELNCGVERVEINSKLLGRNQVLPLLAAATLGVSLGFQLTYIKKVLERIGPIDHSFQVMGGFNGSYIIDDTYKPWLDTMIEALDTLNQVSAKRRFLVIGEIKEFRDNADETYKLLARKIFSDRLDLVITLGEEIQALETELLGLGFHPERLKSNLPSTQVAGALLKLISKGDVILVLGTQQPRLEEIIKKVTKIRT